MDAQRRMRGRWSVTILVLLLSTGLAGCTDQGDEVDPVVQSVRERSQDLVPVDPYADPGPGPNGSCDGCIRLRTISDRITIEPAPGQTTEAPEAPATYRIPFPRGGDMVLIDGQRALDDGDTAIERLVADDGSGNYRMLLRWTAGAEEAVGARRGDGDTVRVRVSDLSEGRTENEPILGRHTLDNATWHVSTANRMVLGTESHLHSTESVDSMIGDGTRPRAMAQRVQTPDAADLFWLGSHFWGRSFSGPERFTTTWTPPGADAPTLRFDHRITHIYEDDVPVTQDQQVGHDHHPHASSEARTTTATRISGFTTASDLHGNEARWSFTLDPESPYPERMLRTLVRMRSVDVSELPLMVREQSATLHERGTETLPFLDRHVQTRAPMASDARFRLIERDVPPVLGTLPVYSLGRAEADLVLYDPNFATWRSAGSILVSADLDRIDAVASDDGTMTGLRADTVPQLRWTLRYVDGHGNSEAWKVARSYDPTVGLGPAPIDFGTVDTGHMSPSLVSLHRGLLWGHDLATGDVAVQAVDQAGWHGAVDTVRYSLVVSPDQSHLGGRLLVAHRPPGLVLPSDADAEPHQAGLVREDLTTGLVEETWSLSLRSDV